MIDRKYTDGNSNVIMLMKLTSWQIITRGTVKIRNEKEGYVSADGRCSRNCDDRGLWQYFIGINVCGRISGKRVRGSRGIFGGKYIYGIIGRYVCFFIRYSGSRCGE